MGSPPRKDYSSGGVYWGPTIQGNYNMWGSHDSPSYGTDSLSARLHTNPRLDPRLSVFRVLGFWVLGFRVLGFRVLGFWGFRVLGFRVLGFRVLGFRVFGFRVLGFWVLGFKV